MGATERVHEGIINDLLSDVDELTAERDRYKAAIEKHRTLMLQAHDVHGGEPGLINTMLWDELGAPFRVKLLRGPVVVVEIEESDLTPVRLVELGDTDDDT